MKDSFEKQLSGGHHNSLGNTEQVVEFVLKNPSRFEELFNCYFSKDELVRLRVSSAVKRITKAQKQIVIPYVDRLLKEITQIDQASTQWTLAALFLLLQKELTLKQKKIAEEHMKHNLIHHKDWIVLNTTMETLFEWAKKEEDLKLWLSPQLILLETDSRKSVSKRASKYLVALS